MSWINYEVAELTWEKGQPSSNGLGSSLSPKQTWASTRPNNDTLESIVHQAASLKPPTSPPSNPTSDSKWRPVAASSRKRSRTESTVANDGKRIWDSNRSNDVENAASYRDGNGGAGRSATSSRGSGGTVMTWPPLPATYHTKPDDFDDKETTTSTRSLSSIFSRRSRASDVHNQSERRRRDRINQKMKALQKLVPNANKTDKASMLDEVIDYLRQLRAQVEMMNNIRSMKPPPQPQMVMMVPNIDQMPLFAGLGMGMNPLASSSSSSSIHMRHLLPPSAFMANTSPPFLLHHSAANMNYNNTCKSSGEANLSSLNAAQSSMDVELYLKNMAAMYQQQQQQVHNSRANAIGAATHHSSHTVQRNK